MKFEGLEPGDFDGKESITFTGPEIDTLKAVYNEDCNTLYINGNPGSVSEFDALVALWDTEKPLKVTIPHEKLAEKLEQFAERTEEEVMIIAQSDVFPRFLNDMPIQRHKMGEAALNLALEIRAAATEYYSQAAPLEIPDPGTVDIDEEFGKIWPGGQSDPAS